MSQQSSTMNLLIHDANGQPQVIKVMQATSGNKAMQTSLKNVYRTQGQDGGQGSVLASGQVLRQIGLQGGKRLVTLPIQQVIGNKGQHVLQKTIRFTPQQMANLKMLSGSPRKIVTMQTSAGSQNVQVLSSNRSASPTNVNSKIISPILDHTGARKRQEHENDYTPEYTKRRKTEKVGKGLRHFSMKVCEKVRRKGTTSYNEVADELVSEFTSGIHGSSPDNQQYDQKNIRRRVYDALNVLMAMNIISKEKKEIRWLGLPTNSVQECRTLEKDKVRRMERIKIKTQQLHDLILQQVSFKSLVERNRLSEQRGNIPNSTSTIELPFIIIKTNKKTKIECSISNDKSEYLFHFENKFQIHDDIEILKRMGLDLGLDKGECTNENLLKAKSLVPRSLETYIEELGRGANPENIMPMYEEEEPEHSRSSLVHAEDLVETTMDEDLSISDHPSDEEEYEEDAMSDGDNQ